MSRTRSIVLAFVTGALCLGLLVLNRPASAASPRQTSGTATPTATAASSTATTVPATATATAVSATSTPPPPPPPPSLGTATPTATAAVPTPTSAPLGADAVLVSRVGVTHSGKTAVVRWKMAYQLGVKGFRVFAKKKDLTPKLIKKHQSRSYTKRVTWANHGRYSLHIIFKNGHVQTKAIR